jgi:hypothetical protein
LPGCAEHVGKREFHGFTSSQQLLKVTLRQRFEQAIDRGRTLNRWHRHSPPAPVNAIQEHQENCGAIPKPDAADTSLVSPAAIDRSLRQGCHPVCSLAHISTPRSDKLQSGSRSADYLATYGRRRSNSFLTTS